MKSSIGLAIGFCVAGTTLSTEAAVTAYEGFDGSPVGLGASGFPAPGGSTGSATAASLSYGSLVTNGVARMGGASWALKAPLSQPVSDGPTVWMSWLYRSDASASAWTRMVTYNGVESYGASERWNLGYIDNGFAVRGSFLAGQTTSKWTVALAPSTTYFLVAKYDFGTAAANDGSITLWVSPDVASLGTGTAPTGGQQISVANASETLMAFGGIAFEAGAATQYDELRLGSSWIDVSPTVPEPAAMGVLAGAGALALRRRQRRA